VFSTYRAGPEQSYETMQLGLREINDARAADFLWQLQSPWRDYPKIGERDACAASVGEGDSVELAGTAP
jgi:hypothetical protein